MFNLFNKFQIINLLFIILFITSPLITQANICQKQLHTNQPHYKEKSLIPSHISLIDIEHHSIRSLSHFVYKLRLKSGIQGVLRIEVIKTSNVSEINKDDVNFEIFSTRFARLMNKEITVPKRVTITDELALEIYKNLNPFADTEFANHLKENKSLNISFLPHYSGAPGSKLANSLFGLEFRIVILELISIPIFNFTPYERLNNEWKKLTINAKHSILTDLNSIFPNDNSTKTNIISLLFSKLAPKYHSQLNLLVEEILINQFPNTIKQQIIDYWALYAILGIPDFHPDNWLFFNDIVIPLDFSYKSIHFINGSKSANLSYQQSPFHGVGISQAHFSYLRKHISKNLKKSFKSLDLKSLERINIACDTQYSLSELEGIVFRAKTLSW